MKLYDVIACRQSIRDFQIKPLEEKILEKLMSYQKNMKNLYPDIAYQIKIHNAMEQELKKTLFQVKAPYYISLSSSIQKGYLLNAGFVMEELALYLNTLGVGTCYQGITHITENKKTDLEEVLVMAVGYPSRYLYREIGTAKRAALEKQCIFKEEPSQQIMTILRAANLAPSSFNSQPWKFVVYKNRIHVFLYKKNTWLSLAEKLQMINMGIVLNHMLVTAEELWLEAEITELDNISSQSIKNNEYIATILIS